MAVFEVPALELLDFSEGLLILLLDVPNGGLQRIEFLRFGRFLNQLGLKLVKRLAPHVSEVLVELLLDLSLNEL